MEGYPVTARIEVRWRDVDAMGHVNNAVYFTYLEIARARYWEAAFQARTIQDINFIVASIQCDFLAPTRYGAEVEVGIRIPSVGRTSFEFAYEARAEGGRPVARARSTQVLYDYAADRKIPLTDAWIDRVASLEGRQPQRR
ncbi:MAG: thioesterase family protein [Thermodesulfobacteriota bacterium]